MVLVTIIWSARRPPVASEISWTAAGAFAKDFGVYLTRNVAAIAERAEAFYKRQGWL